MKLVALKSIGRMRPGDEFEVNGTQARVLKALGKAKDAPEPVSEPEPVAEAPRRRAESEPQPATVEPAPERTVPRFYRRRDMKPED